MILTTEQLYNASQNPRINELSLELLADYYETYLMNETFIFETEDDSPSTRIEICFKEKQFCHLLGIEKIVQRTVKGRDLRDYRGDRGWQQIKSGKLTLSELRNKRNKGQFNSRKDKYVFFYLLPHLLYSPQCVIYDRTKVSGHTYIDSDIIFYEDKIAAYVHIGVKYDTDLGYYVPQTFFVERVTPSNNGRKYIENQNTIKLQRITHS